ncbi:MAG TPA: hypothetical protein VKU01_00140 [Bryobacteraceae bacterium]|nr:hypothetical protein [Bryobacteraceae bacterium]
MASAVNINRAAGEHADPLRSVSPPSTRKFHIVLTLFLLLLGICLLITVTRTARINFTTQDDINMGLLADKMHADGLKPYWFIARNYAQWQGRFYFYFSFFFFAAPYLTSSALVRTAIISFVQFASIGALGWFLSFYLTRLGGFLFVGGTLSLLPLWISVYPTTAHMVVYQIPILFFSLGMVLYVVRIRNPHISRPRSIGLLSSSLISLWISLLVYEVIIIPFFLIALVVSVSELRRKEASSNWRTVVRAILPFGIVFCIWGIIYIGYHSLHPPTYGGATLAPFSLRVFIPDLWRHLVKSLPGANALIGFLPSETRTPPWLSLNLLSDREFLQALLVGALFVVTLLACRPATAAASITRRRLLFFVAFPLICTFLISSPLTLTKKYSNMEDTAIPYLPDYYTFLAFMVVLVALSICISRIPARSIRIFAIAIVGLYTALFTAAGSVANDRVNSFQARSSEKWNLVNRLSASGLLRDLPSDAVVLAPTLWDGVDPLVLFTKDYWGAYIGTRLGRPIRFLRTTKELEDLGTTPKHLYYWTQEWTAHYDSSALLLLPVSVSDTQLGLTGDAVTLVSDHDLSDAALDYRSSTGKGPSRVRIPSLSKRGGIFFAYLPTPGLIAGTTELVLEGPATAVPEVSLAPVEFGQGFAQLERQGRHYWRWSNGPSGEAVFSISNTLAMPIKVKFKTNLLTGGVIKKFSFTFRGVPEVFDAHDGQTYERELTLLPGQNDVEVKCNGPRIKAPGDPRYIVFGFEGWSLTQAGQ